MQLRLSHKALIFSAVLLFELVLVAIFAGRLGGADTELQHSYLDTSVMFHLDNIQRRFTESQFAALKKDGTLARQSEWITYEFGILRELLKEKPESLQDLADAERAINNQLTELRNGSG